ncbi:MAG: outer membrane protein assembly factor BamA [Candidatus Marinimicrobia bacterium]|nr:outer membrane protein assembly factor BamA [Candidatus Neomarinimicrobiota bacterium]
MEILRKMKRIRNIIPIIVVLFAFFISNGYAQSQKIKVLNVTVEGAITASEKIIKLNSGFIAGAELSGEDVQTGIKKLWQLGLFSDVKVIIDKETASGVYLIVMVDEYPRLRKIRYVGNKKYKTKEIKDDISLFRGQIITPHLINKANRKIKDKYKEDGFYNAKVEVSTEVVEGKGNKIDIIFDIKEGKKVKVDEIVFIGNKNFSDLRLKFKLKETKQTGWYKLFIGGKYDKEKFKEDKKTLLKFYRDQGYRDARIVKTKVSLDKEKKHLALKLYIKEGPKYYYGNVSIEGNEKYKTEFLLKSINSAGIKKGEEFKEDDFEMAVDQRIRSIYMDTGYLFAEITPEIEPVGRNKINVKIQITENKIVKIRNVKIIGNDRTRDFVIRRELKVFPGDIFNRERLIRSNREIFMLNYFGDVQPEIVPVDDEHVDLEVSVEEKSSDRVNASIGYSEMNGFIGTVGVQINNLGGRGQRLSTQYSRSYSYQNLSVSFTEPWFMGRPNLVGGSFYYSERNKTDRFYQPYNSQIVGVSLQFGRRFRWPDSYFRGNWSANVSQKVYTDIDEGSVYENYLNEGEKTQERSITQVISRNSRSHPEYPQEGSSISLQTKLSGGILGGNENFLKNKFKVEWWTPIVKNLVFYQNMEVGLLSEFESMKSESIVPYQEYFQMGGSSMVQYVTSLRGYADQSIGPPSSSHAVGNAMFKYSMEMRFLVSPNPTMYVLGFAETGRVWNDFNDIKLNEMVKSVGVGARVYMPMVGMLGFDVGYGFDSVLMDDGPGWETHFVFGRSF